MIESNVDTGVRASVDFEPVIPGQQVNLPARPRVSQKAEQRPASRTTRRTIDARLDPATGIIGARCRARSLTPPPTTPTGTLFAARFTLHALWAPLNEHPSTVRCVIPLSCWMARQRSFLPDHGQSPFLFAFVPPPARREWPD